MTLSEVTYLLVGAGLALSSQMLVQLVIVPRVEVRKRREDRWERHVQDLGEVLTTELDRYAQDARHSQHKFQYIRMQMADNPGGFDELRAKDLMNELNEEVRTAARLYEDLVDGRIVWLVGRVCGIAHGIQKLIKLELFSLTYRASKFECLQYNYEVDFDEEEFNQAWKKERERAQQLLDAVHELANGPAPRGAGPLKRGKRLVKNGLSTIHGIWAGNPKEK